MPHHVYILFSEKLSRYYVGTTDLAPLDRLVQHNSKLHGNSYTSHGVPWKLFYSIQCTSRLQARRIEMHIKRMKSSKYIKNLAKYPELIDRLLERYQV